MTRTLFSFCNYFVGFCSQQSSTRGFPLTTDVFSAFSRGNSSKAAADCTREPKACTYCKAVKELGKNTRLLRSHPGGENQDLICSAVFRERRLSPQRVRAFLVSLTPLTLPGRQMKEHSLWIQRGLGVDFALLFTGYDTLDKPLIFASLSFLICETAPMIL